MTIQLIPCGMVSCPGHGPGKFDSCLGEALHSLSLSSWQNATVGEVDAPIGWNALFSLDSDTVETVDGIDITIPAGNYILTENSQGFIGVSAYADYAAAIAEWTDLELQYDVWGEEGSDPHIGRTLRLTGAWYCDTCDSPYCERA